MKILGVIILLVIVSPAIVIAIAKQPPSAAQSVDQNNSRKIFVIPVEGDVEPAMCAFIARSLRESKKYSDPLIILEMDTFGGEVDAAFAIVDTLLNVTHGNTLAFVKTKAISAGALIALACEKLVMKQGTTLGDCAPLLYTNEGPKMLGEKFQSPLRAKFRALAKRNGYPEVLAEAMVSDNMVVYKLVKADTVFYLDSIGYAELPAAQKKQIVSKTTVISRGRLLTMNDDEARELGFSKMSVYSLEDMLDKMNISNYEIIKMQENWSEAFVRFIGKIAPILLIIGFAGLYIETRTPGFGFAGIIGLICIALVFFSRYMVGLADYTELLIIALGIVLLAVEIFITPGFGLLGITGIVLIMVGILLSFQGFVMPTPNFPWQKKLMLDNIKILLISAIGSIFLVASFLWLGAPFLGKRIGGTFLNATLKDSHVISDSSKMLDVGDEGVADTPLRPSGRAIIKGELYDVVTDGEYIEKGDTVIVSEISGSKIIVARERLT